MATGVRKQPFKAVLRPCLFSLALLPCLVAHARGQVPSGRFDIPQQQLDSALTEYARQSGKQLLYTPDLAVGRTAHAVQGEKTAYQALDELLAGTGLRYAVNGSGTILISDGTRSGGMGGTDADSEPGAQPGNALAAVATPATAASQENQATEPAPPAPTARARADDTTTFDTIVVTAQKKVENIQEVPIAITAFGGEDLNDRKIETGGDLVTATPNVSFTKTNFASYNFQIRGIGTQALSVTTDPAVAVSFNSTPMIRNRLFEQEYFDVERVEVLRGPQGTLYGRNATAGVVNMIPRFADPSAFEADAKGELGSYDTRRVNAMVNVPLSDQFAFRVATQYTKRDGYDHNTVTGRDVNDRDLLSTRVSATFQPDERFRATLAWEHFQEDDNRSRTGKQLCHTDPGPTAIGGIALTPFDRNFLSQGCGDGALDDAGAYGVPNGGSLPFVLGSQVRPVGVILDQDGNYLDLATLIRRGINPYEGVVQSRDLRTIATTYDPKFSASNDIGQLNFEIGVGESLDLVSQTLYTHDRYYSTQDYSRFQSVPVFSNTSPGSGVTNFEGNPVFDLLPGGVYCDPQLGCSDRLLMVDLVDSDSRQWSQEFRLQSSYEGMFNFSVGANYLEYDIDESYYVFSNVFTALVDTFINSEALGEAPGYCPPGGVRFSPGRGGNIPCAYIDPNPLGAIDGQGHNYFRSRNLASTRSMAVFGEGYWRFSDALRLTAGLRWTRDVKTTTPFPTQLLLADSTAGGLDEFFGGYVGFGYPARARIRQTWNEPTGRLVLDWSPDLPFTDSTMLYASASRGYKAGGTNSPGIDLNPEALQIPQRDPRFRAEYVNAFELGMKNVMADGRLVFNATAFYNDYRDYQVSQIVDRATLNENFDAKTWGLEFETVWRPTDRFQLSGNLGLLRTRIGDDQFSIDVMDRTAGNPDWVVVRSWLQLSSNCVAPRDLVQTLMEINYSYGIDVSTYFNNFCSVNTPTTPRAFAPEGGGPGMFGFRYDPAVDGPNGGQGFAKNIGGNDLPNAPEITASLSPQYTFATAYGDFSLRADLYYQGKSWARVYQDRIDRLDAWGNVNLSLTWYRPESNLTVQAYVKNALDSDAITGTFLNSDDTGLTSNVFLQDPRIFGFSVRKGFF